MTTKFNASMLVPASKVEAFSKPVSGARTTTQTALDNLNKLKAAWQAGETPKRQLRVVGDRVGIILRVNNTALVLAPEKDGEGKIKRNLDGKIIGEVELTAPKEHALAALDLIAERVTAGEFSEQLEELSGKKEARTAKRAATKATKAAQKPA